MTRQFTADHASGASSSKAARSDVVGCHTALGGDACYWPRAVELDFRIYEVCGVRFLSSKFRIWE